MAVVSRLELNHPALGTAGGAGLHSSIEALYTKIGDNMNSRWFSITDFDNGETVDLDHNFEMDINLLRIDLWNYTGGEWVKITSSSSPALSAFTIIEKVGSEDTTLQITNVSGGNDLTFAVSLVNDPIYLSEGDVEDVDITTTAPEDGQALVYDSVSGKFKPGASGDSSFKVQSVTDPNAVIKGGYLSVGPSGKELATYDGAGSASTDFGKDLTVSLDTIFGGNPANATAYYLYVDLSTLGAPVTQTDTGRVVYAVVEANFALSTTAPESIDRTRYVPIAVIKSATSGTVWSGAGSAFATLAKFRHDIESTSVGSGGVNYIANPSAASNTNGAVATGACTVTRSTTAAELPRENFSSTAWKFAAGAANDYIRFRPKIGDADKGKQLALSWAQKPESGYVAGDWDIELYACDSGYTTFDQVPLPFSDIPAGETVITIPATTSSADNYEVRFVRKVGSKYLVISELTFGPQALVAVPSFSDFVDSPGWTTSTSNATVTVKEKMIGDMVKIVASIEFTGAMTGGQLQLVPPARLAPMMSKMYSAGVIADDAAIVGQALLNDASITSYIGSIRWYDVGSYFALYAVGNSGGFLAPVSGVDATNPFTWTSGDQVQYVFEYPVAGATSSVFASQTAVMRAANSDVSDADELAGTSTVLGEYGAQFGALSNSRQKRVIFPQSLVGKTIAIETTVDGVLWQNTAESYYIPSYENRDTVSAGISWAPVSGNPNAVDVIFGIYRSFGTTYSGAGTTWAAFAADPLKRWRVVASSNPLLLGHKVVTQNESGLVERAGQLKGTSDSTDVALPGNVGERIEFSANTNSPGTNTYYDVATYDFAAILPGDFEFSFAAILERLGATFSSIINVEVGFTTEAGNSFTNSNSCSVSMVASLTDLTAAIVPVSLANVRVQWDGTDLTINGVAGSGSTLILKGYLHNHTAGTPRITAKAKGIRIR